MCAYVGAVVCHYRENWSIVVFTVAYSADSVHRLQGDKASWYEGSVNSKKLKEQITRFRKKILNT